MVGNNKVGINKKSAFIKSRLFFSRLKKVTFCRLFFSDKVFTYGNRLITYIVVSLFIKPCLPLLSHTHSYFYHFYFFIMIIKLTTLSQGNLTYHSTGFSTYIMISPGREPGPGRTFAFTAQFLRLKLNSTLNSTINPSVTLTD